MMQSKETEDVVACSAKEVKSTAATLQDNKNQSTKQSHFNKCSEN